MLPVLDRRDAARVVGEVLAPVVARGVVVRRPRAVALAERFSLDRRAVQVLVRLRDKHGSAPLHLRLAGRHLAVVLDRGDADRVLAETPVPFATDTREKRGVLRHFEPAGVLVSRPEHRPARRAFNEAVLETGHPHRLAEQFRTVVREELAQLPDALTWEPFADAWWRLVRRIVLGDAARDDTALTDQLLALRRRGNWSYLAGRSDPTPFLEDLARHVGRAEAGSLAARISALPTTPGTEPVQQVPQWLFAFDAGAWTTFRALAAIGSGGDRVAADQGFAQACVREALRLWPTTPAILRETTEQTWWDSGTLPKGTTVLVFAPLFHRDPTRVAQADSWAPGTDGPWLPFSAGPAACPGQDLVLLVMTEALQVLSRRYASPGIPSPAPAPLNPFPLSFGAGP